MPWKKIFCVVCDKPIYSIFWWFSQFVFGHNKDTKHEIVITRTHGV